MAAAMTRAMAILGLRLLLPLGCVAFGLVFFLETQGRGRSEILFPYLLIAALLVAAMIVTARELASYFAARRLSAAAFLDKLDVDGLRSRGWWRSFFVSLSCLLYLFLFDRLGLLPTAFLAYLTCAASLLPDRSDWRQWARTIAVAALVAAILDVLFRVWLGLPLPAPFPG